MFNTVKKVKNQVTDRTVYMEVYGENKVAYRVISGRIGKTVTYGIETEDYKTGEKEVIPDFSLNMEDAVCFVEMLIKSKTSPKYM
ncbi:MAG: hypothetical protein K2O29_07570, partial [Ruminococcus sp.]|nr:hypothetical protein [Ruminococcus sp.]MDE7138297.1 hypothetical protein [Ruminococcus sp.]